MTRHHPVTRHRRLLVAAIAIAFACAPALVASAPASADPDTDDFTFASYDADYYLTRADDGSSRLRTVETLVAEFPATDQNKGIIRAIPLGFEGADLRVAVESVTDADGTPVPFTQSDDDGFREVSIGTDDYVHGDQTYVITYDQQNVVRAYDDTAADEFYWDLNGTGWEQPFGSVTGRVHIPTELAGELTGSSACYAGSSGSTDTCRIEETTDAGGSVFAVSVDGVGAEQTVTVAIGFEQGAFTEPARPKDQPWVPVVPWLVAIPGGLLAAIAALMRFTRGRDARGRGIIVAQYERPADVDLLEAGELVERRSASMSAQLMDLAVRGNLRVIDMTPDDSDEATVFALEFVSFTGLSEPEREVVRAVFGRHPKPGKRTVLGGSVQVGTDLRVQAEAAKLRVIERGFRRAVSAAYIGTVATVAAVIGVVALTVFVVLAVIDGLSWVSTLLLIAAVALAVLAVVGASKRSTVTDSGAAVRDHLDGMRDYIQLAEADRLRMLQSPDGAQRRTVDPADPAQVVRVYEKLLPFAILFGYEKQWSRELERLYGAADYSPTWYSGTHPFNGGAFNGFLVSSQAQASASAWSSSGTGSSFGGSTGGGFAGGGGGGGGGGGR